MEVQIVCTSLIRMDLARYEIFLALRYLTSYAYVSEGKVPREKLLKLKVQKLKACLCSGSGDQIEN